MYRFILITTAVISAPAWAAAGAGAAAAQEVAAITDPPERAQAPQDIQEMKARIARIEAALGVPSSPPPMQYTPERPRKPRDHNLALYGFAELDAIQNFK